jgi:hypothetical protein
MYFRVNSFFKFLCLYSERKTKQKKHKSSVLFNFEKRNTKYDSKLMQTQRNELNIKGQNIYLGIAVH